MAGDDVRRFVREVRLTDATSGLARNRAAIDARFVRFVEMGQEKRQKSPGMDCPHECRLREEAQGL